MAVKFALVVIAGVLAVQAASAAVHPAYLSSDSSSVDSSAELDVTAKGRVARQAPGRNSPFQQERNFPPPPPQGRNGPQQPQGRNGPQQPQGRNGPQQPQGRNGPQQPQGRNGHQQPQHGNGPHHMQHSNEAISLQSLHSASKYAAQLNEDIRHITNDLKALLDARQYGNIDAVQAAEWAVFHSQLKTAAEMSSKAARAMHTVITGEESSSSSSSSSSSTSESTSETSEEYIDYHGDWHHDDAYQYDDAHHDDYDYHY